jgi:hypothetical protein
MSTTDTFKLVGNAMIGMVLYFTLLLSPLL